MLIFAIKQLVMLHKIHHEAYGSQVWSEQLSSHIFNNPRNSTFQTLSKREPSFMREIIVLVASMGRINTPPITIEELVSSHRISSDP